MTSHCSFYLHFLKTKSYSSSWVFIIYSPWGNIQIFCTFFKLLLVFLNIVLRVLHVFEIQIFYQIHHLQKFSPILLVVFLLSWWCLLKYKIFFMLMKSNIPIFSFVICTFCVISEKPLLNPGSWEFTLIFSSQCFIVLALHLSI